MQIPGELLFVIRKLSGAYVTEPPSPDVGNGAGVVPYPPGEWVHIAEQPYERGTYEVRIYGTNRLYELARTTLTI